jgi:hypothetical protein
LPKFAVSAQAFGRLSPVCSSFLQGEKRFW